VLTTGGSERPAQLAGKAVAAPSDLSLHPGAPREPVLSGALQCSVMPDGVATSHRRSATAASSHPLELHGFGLEEFFEAVAAVLAAGAGLFVAAEGGHGVGFAAVDFDLPGSQLSGHRFGVIERP
jgi:hypothetical protein